MAKTLVEAVEEQETQSAQAAADEGVSGPEKKPGDPGFRVIEDDPELLGKLQSPHAQDQKKPAMAWFTNAYGQPVLGPL